MTIPMTHASISHLLARLIIVLTEEYGLPIKGCGDMTCRRQDLDRGMEPDECFYLNNEPRIRGREELDFDIDPPPDLGLEIEITRRLRSRIGIYAALGIPEAWQCDGKALKIWQLNENGEYDEAPESQFFPSLPITEIPRFLEQRNEMDDNSLIKSFRKWVQEHMPQNN